MKKHAFESLAIKDLQLKNRIVMPPMCMYSSDASGRAKDFHKVHYGSRAIGGAGLIIQEATAVVRNGRISNEDLGIWEDAQVDDLAEVVRLIHAGGARAAIQLAHAGRKCETDDAFTVAPSSFAFSDDYRIPHELTIDEIETIVASFGLAAERAVRAGYDALEIHGAHGYLIHEFLSPLSNRRTDAFGGSFENRLRFLKAVIGAIRQVWPRERALLLRLSASDYLQGGIDLEETIQIIDQVKDDVDLFDISSGGLLAAPVRSFPGYQVEFAGEIRKRCQVATIAVGLIIRMEHVENILGSGKADLVALGRELLRNPYWPIQHSSPGEVPGCPIPEQYERAWK